MTDEEFEDMIDAVNALSDRELRDAERYGVHYAAAAANNRGQTTYDVSRRNLKAAGYEEKD